RKVLAIQNAACELGCVWVEPDDRYIVLDRLEGSREAAWLEGVRRGDEHEIDVPVGGLMPRDDGGHRKRIFDRAAQLVPRRVSEIRRGPADEERDLHARERSTWPHSDLGSKREATEALIVVCLTNRRNVES